MSANSKILKRLLVLMALVLCLGWLSLADNVSQVYASRCCEECPGFENPGEEVGYCSDQCGGATSGTCYNQCMNQVRNCYQGCHNCGSSPPGSACATSSDCSWSAFWGYGTCVNNICVYD